MGFGGGGAQVSFLLVKHRANFPNQKNNTRQKLVATTVAESSQLEAFGPKRMPPSNIEMASSI
ncbi:MAG: hypothetical protein ACI8RD_002519 [Bacillariaceae sp.]|jgi:hypothetical protein